MEHPCGDNHPSFEKSDQESEAFFNDAPIVLTKLQPGYEMVGEPFLKPNGNGYVRIYSGAEQLGELAGRYDPQGRFAIVVDTDAEHYAEAAGEHGAVCVTHHMDESEWLIWFVNMFVESVCKIEAKESGI